MAIPTWSPPRRNSLSAVKLTDLTVPDAAGMGVALEGSELSWPNATTTAILPVFDRFSNKQHYIEVFNKGKQPFDYSVSTDVPWLSVSKSKGTVGENDARILFSVNENKLPKGNAEGYVTLSGAGTTVRVRVKAINPTVNEPLKGFIESNGQISIEAEHFSKNVEKGTRKWIKVDDYGLTLSGMRATAPANAQAAVVGKDAPCLEYPVYFFSSDTAQITVITSPLLNVMPDRPIQFAVSFDNEPATMVTNVPDKFKVHYSNPGWAQTVVKQARHCTTTLKLSKPGKHTLKVWMIDPGVIVEKILINTGGLQTSTLGPKESVRIN